MDSFSFLELLMALPLCAVYSTVYENAIYQLQNAFWCREDADREEGMWWQLDLGTGFAFIFFNVSDKKSYYFSPCYQHSSNCCHLPQNQFCTRPLACSGRCCFTWSRCPLQLQHLSIPEASFALSSCSVSPDCWQNTGCRTSRAEGAGEQLQHAVSLSPAPRAGWGMLLPGLLAVLEDASGLVN